jgi:hypothetical protein
MTAQGRHHTQRLSRAVSHRSRMPAPIVIGSTPRLVSNCETNAPERETGNKGRGKGMKRRGSSGLAWAGGDVLIPPRLRGAWDGSLGRPYSPSSTALDAIVSSQAGRILPTQAKRRVGGGKVGKDLPKSTPLRRRRQPLATLTGTRQPLTTERRRTPSVALCDRWPLRDRWSLWLRPSGQGRRRRIDIFTGRRQVRSASSTLAPRRRELASTMPCVGLFKEASR